MGNLALVQFAACLIWFPAEEKQFKNKLLHKAESDLEVVWIKLKAQVASWTKPKVHRAALRFSLLPLLDRYRYEFRPTCLREISLKSLMRDEQLGTLSVDVSGFGSHNRKRSTASPYRNGKCQLRAVLILVALCSR